MITGSQIRAARALLNVKQSELARAAGVALATLNNIERGVGDPRTSTLSAIERCLSDAGVWFENVVTQETVSVQRLERASAQDAFSVCAKLAYQFEETSLLPPTEFVAFIRYADGMKRPDPQKNGSDIRAGFVALHPTRATLYDVAEFSCTDSVRVGEIANAMIPAASRIPKALSMIEGVLPDTSMAHPEEALAAIKSGRKRRLTDPVHFIEALDRNETGAGRFAQVEGHPLRTLSLLMAG